jgi:hypothetical protein
LKKLRKTIYENSDKLSHFATVLTLGIAAIALGVAVKQICASNRSQKEATAQETYREYLMLAIDKPELAEAGILYASASAQDKAKYVWFVSYLLYSSEQIYLLFPNDKGLDQRSRHKATEINRLGCFTQRIPSKIRIHVPLT